MFPNPGYHPVYAELDRDRFCTRLLQLLPPSHEAPDEIHCNIAPKYLDSCENPEYEALSYTWGEPGNEYSIVVNGLAFPVRKNLLSALRHLRLKGEPRWLWIDALCINQASNEEKDIQVSQMHRIYQLARRVVIWLGDSTATGLRAFALIKGICDFHSALDPLQTYSWDGTVRSQSQERCSDEAALAEIFSRSWWTRVWVIQEAAYAQEVSFMCGHATLSIDWFSLVRTYSWVLRNVSEDSRLIIERAGIVLFSVQDAIEDIRADPRRVRLKEVWWRPRALYMLESTRFLLATDPRDCVFATLNLTAVSDLRGERRLVPVDYEMDTASVFTSAARAIAMLLVSRHHLNFANLEILCSVELLSNEADFQCHPAVDPLVWTRRVDVPGLPSWVPNWAQPRITKRLFRDYKASKGMEMEWHIEQETEPAKDCILRMRALRIGVIATMGIDFTCTNSTAKDVFEDLRVMTAGMEVYRPPRQTYSEALNGTLLGLHSGEYLPRMELTKGFDVLSEAFHGSIEKSMLGRRTIVLQTGFMGLALRAARVGDAVYIVPDCGMTIVMRERSGHTKNGAEDAEDERFYQVIGPCYIHGVMNGEASGLAKDFVPDKWQFDDIVVR